MKAGTPWAFAFCTRSGNINGSFELTRAKSFSTVDSWQEIMSSPTFKTIEVAQLYEEIECWSHPEHPFLDPKYSLESNAPAGDLTPYVTTWLAAGREDAISELWKFLTYRQEAFASDLALQDALYALRKVLKARLPSGIQLSETLLS